MHRMLGSISRLSLKNRSFFRSVRAIAYLRFSADDQAQGNSIARQTANTDGYCQRNGLERVETLVDDGYSAFKGHHMSKGALGRFLTLADEGKYKGYALVIEQMDRLSRQGIIETSDLLRRILKAGLEVHVTQTNRVIRSLDDVTTAILNVMESYAAQEYSRKLRERVASAWAAKKHNGTNGISITNKLPGWLEGRSGERIKVNEEKAKVVRQIFEWTAKGMGKRLVARRLNERKVPTFGGGKKVTEYWVHSYIHKILTNRAVLGEYQPRKGGKPDGEVRINFYPPVVTPALWERANAVRASRRTVTQNGTVTGKYAGRTGKASNLFTGLVFDATMQRPMHYSDKGKRSRPTLSTACKDINGNRPNSVIYSWFERAFLEFLSQLDWTTVLDIAESDEIKRQEEAIASLNLDIARTEEKTQELAEKFLAVKTPAAALNSLMLKLEAQIEKDRGDREARERRLAQLKREHNDLLDRSIVYDKLAKARDLETRSRLRQEIHQKVSRIDFYFNTSFRDLAEPYLTHGEPAANHTLVKVIFINGAVRWIVFEGNTFYLTWMAN